MTAPAALRVPQQRGTAGPPVCPARKCSSLRTASGAGVRWRGARRRAAPAPTLRRSATPLPHGFSLAEAAGRAGNNAGDRILSRCGRYLLTRAAFWRLAGLASPGCGPPRPEITTGELLAAVFGGSDENRPGGRDERRRLMAAVCPASSGRQPGDAGSAVSRPAALISCAGGPLLRACLAVGERGQDQGRGPLGIDGTGIDVQVIGPALVNGRPLARGVASRPVIPVSFPLLARRQRRGQPGEQAADAGQPTAPPGLAVQPGGAGDHLVADPGQAGQHREEPLLPRARGPAERPIPFRQVPLEEL